MTTLQKKYYRALYEKNVEFLLRGGDKKALDAPSLSNLAMQLRKCCNHPFLLNGVEAEVSQPNSIQPNSTQPLNTNTHSQQIIMCRLAETQNSQSRLSPNS